MWAETYSEPQFQWAQPTVRCHRNHSGEPPGGHPGSWHYKRHQIVTWVRYHVLDFGEHLQRFEFFNFGRIHVLLQFPRAFFVRQWAPPHQVMRHLLEAKGRGTDVLSTSLEQSILHWGPRKPSLWYGKQRPLKQRPRVDKTRDKQGRHFGRVTTETPTSPVSASLVWATSKMRSTST